MNYKHINKLIFIASICSCGVSPPNQSDSETSGIDLTTSVSGETTDFSTTEDIRLDLPDYNSTSTGEETGCVDVSVQIDPVIPTLLLLVDQSGSMDEDFGGVERWDAVYETLMDPVDGVVPLLEDRVRFGLALYTGEDEQCPMLTVVDPALGNYSAIDAVYSVNAPLGETPTGESLDIVAADLAIFAEPGPKGIVLATDGEPDTCAVPNPSLGQPEAIAAAQNAWNLDIQTFIVSVGADVSLGHLQEMANAGAGKPVDELLDPEPYYQALNPADLVSAFQAIIADFVSCEFTLDGEIIGDPCKGTVLLDGNEIECGADWDATSDTTIELIGEACDLLKDGDVHTIEVSFPCGSVLIP